MLNMTDMFCVCMNIVLFTATAESAGWLHPGWDGSRDESSSILFKVKTLLSCYCQHHTHGHLSHKIHSLHAILCKKKQRRRRRRLEENGHVAVMKSISGHLCQPANQKELSVMLCYNIISHLYIYSEQAYRPTARSQLQTCLMCYLLMYFWASHTSVCIQYNSMAHTDITAVACRATQESNYPWFSCLVSGI